MIQDGVLKLRIPEQLMNGVFQRSRTFFQPSSDRLVRGCTDERENQIEKSDANRDVECRKSKHKRTSAIEKSSSQDVARQIWEYRNWFGPGREVRSCRHNTLKELCVKTIRRVAALL